MQLKGLSPKQRQIDGLYVPILGWDFDSNHFARRIVSRVLLGSRLVEIKVRS